MGSFYIIIFPGKKQSKAKPDVNSVTADMATLNLESNKAGCLSDYGDSGSPVSGSTDPETDAHMACAARVAGKTCPLQKPIFQTPGCSIEDVESSEVDDPFDADSKLQNLNVPKHHRTKHTLSSDFCEKGLRPCAPKTGSLPLKWILNTDGDHVPEDGSPEPVPLSQRLQQLGLTTSAPTAVKEKRSNQIAYKRLPKKSECKANNIRSTIGGLCSSNVPEAGKNQRCSSTESSSSSDMEVRKHQRISTAWAKQTKKGKPRQKNKAIRAFMDELVADLSWSFSQDQSLQSLDESVKQVEDHRGNSASGNHPESLSERQSKNAVGSKSKTGSEVQDMDWKKVLQPVSGLDSYRNEPVHAGSNCPVQTRNPGGRATNDSLPDGISIEEPPNSYLDGKAPMHNSTPANALKLLGMSQIGNFKLEASVFSDLSNLSCGSSNTMEGSLMAGSEDCSRNLLEQSSHSPACAKMFVSGDTSTSGTACGNIDRQKDAPLKECISDASIATSTSELSPRLQQDKENLCQMRKHVVCQKERNRYSDPDSPSRRDIAVKEPSFDTHLSLADRLKAKVDTRNLLDAFKDHQGFPPNQEHRLLYDSDEADSEVIILD